VIGLSQIPTDGLVGYWPLDGTADDASLNSNPGVVYGASPTFDHNNQTGLAYYFDGDDDFIEILDQDYLSFGDGLNDVPFSISFWIKPIFINDYQAVLGKWDQFDTGVEYIVYLSQAGKIRFQVEDESTQQKKLLVESTTALSETFWTNITVTYYGSKDASGLSIYSNGLKINQNVLYNDLEYGAMENTPQNLWFGKYVNYLGEPIQYKGSLDEVRVYNRVLTDSEILQIYNSSSLSYDCSIIYCDGENVGIGTSTPDNKLTVNGTIHTKEVRVDMEGFEAPDFVFEENYDLSSLEETSQFIQANKHLPDIPSAVEMQQQGINLKELNLKLLQKIEELTLHLIEQEKQQKNQYNKIIELTNKSLRQGEEIAKLRQEIIQIKSSKPE
jgi:hypothetical protein